MPEALRGHRIEGNFPGTFQGNAKLGFAALADARKAMHSRNFTAMESNLVIAAEYLTAALGFLHPSDRRYAVLSRHVARINAEAQSLEENGDILSVIRHEDTAAQKAGSKASA